MSAPAALPRVLPSLRCPLCGDTLNVVDNALRCPRRHTFNIARQGYISFLAGAKARSGDDDAMILARNRFLDSGAYDPLRSAIAEQVKGALRTKIGSTKIANQPSSTRPFIVDAGSGTGHYLASALDAVRDLDHSAAAGFGFDTAVRGARLTARAHPDAVAATWDVFQQLPLATGSADVVLDVFSPRNPAEFARVIAPTGALIVARPASQHLHELREAIPEMVAIDPRKEERLHTALQPHFTESQQQLVEFTVALADNPTAIADLVGMTPSARHLDATRLATKKSSGPELPRSVAAAVIVSAWTPIHQQPSA